MKKYVSLSEAAKSAILRTNFQVFPYEWETFKNVVTASLPKTMKFITDGDDELLVDGKDILCRYDSYDHVLYTDIDKADFHQDVQAKKLNKLKKYIK